MNFWARARVLSAVRRPAHFALVAVKVGYIAGRVRPVAEHASLPRLPRASRCMEKKRSRTDHAAGFNLRRPRGQRLPVTEDFEIRISFRPEIPNVLTTSPLRPAAAGKTSPADFSCVFFRLCLVSWTKRVIFGREKNKWLQVHHAAACGPDVSSCAQLRQRAPRGLGGRRKYRNAFCRATIIALSRVRGTII